MAYDIQWMDKGVIITYQGLLNTYAIAQLNNTLYSDNRFDDCRYIIDDYLKADISPLNELTSKKSAATDYGASKSNPNLKLAMVIKGSRQIELANIFICTINKLHCTWECKIFGTLTEAKAWCTS